MSLTIDQTPKRRYPDAGVGTTTSRSFYRVGSLAAALAAVLTPVTIAVFALWPPPYEATAKEWFDLYQDSALLGLMSLDLGFVIISILVIPVMLALYVALGDVRPAHTAIAGVLYLVAAAAYFGTNTSFEMLSLSNRYAEAATEAQRLSLLGAGEAMLATFDGTAFHVYYVLGQLAGIIFGIVMLRSHLFTKAIAYLMIAGNAFGFLLYVPEFGLTLSALSGVILWFWMILIARRFFQLSRQEV